MNHNKKVFSFINWRFVVVFHNFLVPMAKSFSIVQDPNKVDCGTLWCQCSLSMPRLFCQKACEDFLFDPLHICEAALEVKGHLHHGNDMIVIEQLCPGVRGRENYLRSGELFPIFNQFKRRSFQLWHSRGHFHFWSHSPRLESSDRSQYKWSHIS